MTAPEYLECDHACPHCGASFNPGCRRHVHLYFEGVESRVEGPDSSDDASDSKIREADSSDHTDASLTDGAR